ncbi:hypothetical protein D3C73_1332570 [compost metagenome]
MLLVTPSKKIVAAKATADSAKEQSGSDKATRRPPISRVLRLPIRVTRIPAKYIVSIVPAANALNAKPSSESVRANACFIPGIFVAQIASTMPLMKNITDVATLARPKNLELSIVTS